MKKKSFEEKLEEAWKEYDNLPSTKACEQFKNMISSLKKCLNLDIITEIQSFNGSIDIRVKILIKPGYHDLLFTAKISQTGYPITTEYDIDDMTGVTTYCEDLGGLENWLISFVTDPKIKSKLGMYKSLAKVSG